jgi:hypothetical protein
MAAKKVWTDDLGAEEGPILGKDGKVGVEKSVIFDLGLRGTAFPRG